MRPRSPMPVLAIPFALVGSAAGWLAAGLLANPLVSLALRRAQPIAALVGCLAGAAVGGYLSRCCAPRAGEPDLLPAGRLAVGVLLAGVLTGAITGALTIGLPGHVYSSALAGLLSAAAFLPICVLVLAAARRASRARLGSIVAGADRRAVWAILAASLSCMTLAALPDWPASISDDVRTPYAALGLAVAAVALCATLLAADVAAERRVGAARSAATGMEAQDAEDEASAGAEVPCLDLGIGDEVMARVARSADAYRGRDRSTALLVGSPEEAQAALRTARRRATVGLVAAVSALGGQVVAARGGADLGYDIYRCDDGLAWSCHEAALRIESTRPGRSTVLHQRACRGGVHESCEILLERGPVPHYEQSCEQGDGSSCRALASLYLRGMDSPPRAPDRRRAAELLRGSCRDGDHASCRALLFTEVRELPCVDSSGDACQPL